MPRIVMSKWTLDVWEDPSVRVEADVSAGVDGTEESQLDAVRKLLGGAEDATGEGPDGAMLFRRLDRDAPGGVGWMVSGRLLPDVN